MAILSVPRNAHAIYITPDGRSHEPGDTFELSDEHHKVIGRHFFDKGLLVDGELEDEEEERRREQEERDTAADRARDHWRLTQEINGIDPDEPILYGRDSRSEAYEPNVDPWGIGVGEDEDPDGLDEPNVHSEGAQGPAKPIAGAQAGDEIIDPSASPTETPKPRRGRPPKVKVDTVEAEDEEIL